MKTTGYLFAWLALCAGLAACTERPLCLRPQPRLNIRLLWPDSTQVEGADLFIYDGTGNLVSRLSSPPEGMSLYLPEDCYTVLAANADAGEVSYESIEDWTACSVNAHLLGDGSGYFQQVDHVYTAGLSHILLERKSGSRTIVLEPADRIRHIVVSIVAAQIPEVSQMFLKMEGVVQSVRLFDGADVLDETVTVNSDLNRIYDGDPASVRTAQGEFLYYTASMSVFGWRGDNPVVIEIHYEDGSVEQSRPVNIATDLEGLPQPGGELWFEVETQRGEKIQVNMLVDDWVEEEGKVDVYI